MSTAPSSYDPQTNTIGYTCQATLPSYYVPTFRSFIVSNTFSFVGPVEIVLDGHKLEIPINPAEVAVLSSAMQQLKVRKINSMTTSRKTFTRA